MASDDFFDLCARNDVNGIVATRSTHIFSVISRLTSEIDRSASKESDSAQARSLAQTHRFANTFHDLVRDFIRAGCAFFENVVDVQFVG
jgi:hypothetical protein